MVDSDSNPPQLWPRASVKNALIFVSFWLSQAFLTLTFVKWVIHGGAAVYWFMIPYALFGAIVFLPRQWLLRFERARQKFEEDAGALYEKRIPPGFP